MASFVVKQEDAWWTNVHPHSTRVAGVSSEGGEDWVSTILSCCTTRLGDVEFVRCIVTLFPPSRPVFGQTFPHRNCDRGRMTWSLHATELCISCADLQHVALHLVVGRVASVLVFRRIAYVLVQSIHTCVYTYLGIISTSATDITKIATVINVQR